MAEEEVFVSPEPSDHKRKLDSSEHLQQRPPETTSDPPLAVEEDGVVKGTSFDEVVPESKRAKLTPDDLAGENGFIQVKEDQNGKEEEDAKEELTGVKNDQTEGDIQPSPPSVKEITNKGESDGIDNTQQAYVEDSKVEDSERPLSEGTEDNEKASQEEIGKSTGQEFEEEPTNEGQPTSRKMEVPNDKVGVLIGKGGDTIRYLQYNSGAKIQITRDADADPQAVARPVEIIGTISSINKAEKLIAAVIAEADAGGSPSLVARGLPTAQNTGVGDQIEIRVPNEKVGLIIGRGGETIKNLQARSGARIQLIPQHLPEGDGSKDRIVRVTGEKRKIELAREMIMDVTNQTARPSNLSGSLYQQQQYRPRGPSGPHWGPRGPLSSHPMPYEYQQRVPYPSQSSHYPPSAYGGGGPHQMAPRGNFGTGWEQRPPSMQGSLPHGGGYDYYSISSQGGHGPDHSISAPISGHGPFPAPTTAMVPPPSQTNYYGQPHGPDYGHQAPYSQHPQQSYGHGYDELKYDNHAPPQHHYGQGGSQPFYPHASNQPGFSHQQYAKPPSYGMTSQGPAPQPFGPPRPSHPGDVPYQAPVQSTQSQTYGPTVPQQQQYPYASSAPAQQPYPSYGSAPATDSYSQAQSNTAGYPQQQGSQAVPTYGQPAGQQAAGYVQGPSGVYGSYSSAQSYPEQAASGYQGDPAYGSGQQGYAAQPSSQPAYAQATTQPNYDQSATQSGGYGSAASASVAGYGKTASPQAAAGYSQYDSSSQMYAVPH